VDLERVYATGLSNGAMMAYRLGLEAPDLVAAIAPVAGASAIGPNDLERSMPIMHIHSVDDPRALYGGGLGPPFPMTNQRVLHAPVEKMLKVWRDADGCADTSQTSASRRGGPHGEHSATKLVYAPCRDGVEVVLWKMTGPGHVWPGGKPDYLTRWLGPSTDVIDANREIWGFLRRFARHH
jgi:polyhydroxybutyrate depolymerase